MPLIEKPPLGMFYPGGEFQSREEIIYQAQQQQAIQTGVEVAVSKIDSEEKIKHPF